MGSKNRKNRKNQTAVVLTENPTESGAASTAVMDAPPTQPTETVMVLATDTVPIVPSDRVAEQAARVAAAGEQAKDRKPVDLKAKAAKLAEQNRRVNLKLLAEDHPALKPLVREFLIRVKRRDTLTGDAGNAEEVKRRQEREGKNRADLERQLKVLEDRVALLKAKLGDTTALTVINADIMQDVRTKLVAAAKEAGVNNIEEMLDGITPAPKDEVAKDEANNSTGTGGDNKSEETKDENSAASEETGSSDTPEGDGAGE